MFFKVWVNRFLTEAAQSQRLRFAVRAGAAVWLAMELAAQR